MLISYPIAREGDDRSARIDISSLDVHDVAIQFGYDLVEVIIHWVEYPVLISYPIAREGDDRSVRIDISSLDIHDVAIQLGYDLVDDASLWPKI